MRLVDERRAVFDDHNLFRLAVLGLVSASRRLDRLLAAHGHSPDGPASLVPEAVEDDPLLCAVLGLIAFRDRVLLHLGSALRGSPLARPVAAEASAAPPAPRELLR